MAEPLAALGQSADPNALAYRSALLPLGRTNAGSLTWAVPQAVLSALGAVQYPGQVYRGEASIYDPATGRISDEAVGKSFDLAGTAMTGALPFKAPKGALRMFGGAAEQGADDVLGSLEAALSKSIADNPQPPPTGPRRLDPNAASWDVYHGSPGGPDFQRFDPQVASNPAERGAVFFAPNPETANGYTATGGIGEAGARVFRANVEPGQTKVFDLADLAETDPAFSARAREITTSQAGAGHGALFDDAMANFRANRGQDREIAAQLQEMGYVPGEPTGVSHNWGHIGAAVERAKAEGLDTAILRGLAEHGGDDQVIALTPNRVRSFYDPRQILFSGLPLGFGLAGAGMLASPSDARAAPLSALGR